MICNSNIQISLSLYIYIYIYIHMNHLSNTTFLTHDSFEIGE